MWETSLLRFMETSYPEIGSDINKKKQLTEENEAKLRTALDAFSKMRH